MSASPGRTLRATAMLALAGFAVHQVRYALVPDVHGETGHAYLHSIAPAALAVLVTIALGRSLAALGAPAARRALPWRLRWLAASGALLVLHVAQEGAERVLAGGGPLGKGALLAVPLCLLAGAAVALALRGADELLAAAAPASAALRPATLAAPVSTLLPAPPAPARAAVLAGHLAGRAPPLLG